MSALKQAEDMARLALADLANVVARKQPEPITTFDQWHASVRRCGKHYDPNADVVLKDALGIAGEAGEVVELIKKDRFQGQPLDRAKLKKELGDLLWYLTSMAANNGMTLTEIATENDAKLRERYPNGFVPGGGVR